MSLNINGVTVVTDHHGNLVNPTDWNEEVAHALATAEGISELTERHFAVFEYLRDQYFNHNKQPNGDQINRAMSNIWNVELNSVNCFKVDELFELFPSSVGVQATRLAGLPTPVR